MTWQDDQKQVATGVTDGTDGRKYSTVFPYEPVAWGMPSAGEGHIVDVITPEEHARVEGGYTVPLYTAPPRNRAEDDDDIQEYKRPWVGLTDDEIDQGLLRSDYAFKTAEAWRAGVVFAMTKLKDKNT